SGLERDTVVIFTSDHGDHDGEHRLTMKRSFYEAAAHVPLLVRWPGRVPTGRVDDVHLINNGIDLLPTLCDLAGAAPPAGLPGRSFLPLAHAQPPAGWPELIVSETVAGRMLRTARYKYCIYHHAGVSEELLCDLLDDPLETENLAPSPPHQATLQEHRTLLADWTRHHADPSGAAYLAAL
ncbi:MAG: sulfatase-like hydrolase/transferase, partial [Chloroflexota bacterium]|nr:sulfatase-like hydrolase/transferase [Chloroflexota bacterium]